MINSSLLGTMIFSLLLVLLLSFVPLRGDEAFWRPQLALLLVIFWLINEPDRFGIGFAWCCGLALDLLTGGILGMHALALAVCAYLLTLLGRRMRHFSIWHHTVLVALLAVAYQLTVIFVNLLANRDAQHWELFFPVVTTTLVWPLLARLLGWLYQPAR